MQIKEDIIFKSWTKMECKVTVRGRNMHFLEPMRIFKGFKLVQEYPQIIIFNYPALLS